MFIVDSITSDAKQKQNLVLPSGATFTVEMEYKPLQQGWFFTSISYGDFTLTNLRICTSPNLLHQYKNKLPFGIAVTSLQNGEPTQQQDFFVGNSVMYVLTEEEVAEYANYLTNG